MKTVIGFILAVLFGLWVTGCASIDAYKDYTGAYSAYIGAKGVQGANKLVEIIPNDGKPITIDAKSFTVYAPQTGDGGIRPPEQIKNSEWVATVDRVLGGALTLGTTAVIGSAVKGMFNSAVTNAGHNTNTVISDSGNTATSNTTATTTTNTDSGNTTTNTDSGNTTTDSHNVDSHNDSHNTDNHSVDSHNAP